MLGLKLLKLNHVSKSGYRRFTWMLYLSRPKFPCWFTLGLLVKDAVDGSSLLQHSEPWCPLSHRYTSQEYLNDHAVVYINATEWARALCYWGLTGIKHELLHPQLLAFCPHLFLKIVRSELCARTKVNFDVLYDNFNIKFNHLYRWWVSKMMKESGFCSVNNEFPNVLDLYAEATVTTRISIMAICIYITDVKYRLRLQITSEFTIGSKFK